MGKARLTAVFKKDISFYNKWLFIVYTVVLLLIFVLSYNLANPLFLSTLYFYPDMPTESGLNGIIISFLLLTIVILIAINLLKRNFKNLLWLVFAIFLSSLLLIGYFVFIGSFSTIILSRTGVKGIDLKEQKNLEILERDKIKLIADPTKLVSCYLADNDDFFVKILSIIGGKSILFNIGNDSVYYVGKSCELLLIGHAYSDRNAVFDERVGLADKLIMSEYSAYINKSNLDVVKAKILEANSDPNLANALGYYLGREGGVIINGIADKDYHYPLQTIIHEFLHARSSGSYNFITNQSRSGFMEGVTEYLTGKITDKYFDPAIESTVYLDQQNVVKSIINLIGIDAVLKAYFDGSIYDIIDHIDSKLCVGAGYTVIQYLDESVIAYLDRNSSADSNKFAGLAIEGIKNPDCNGKPLKQK